VSLLIDTTRIDAETSTHLTLEFMSRVVRNEAVDQRFTARATDFHHSTWSPERSIRIADQVLYEEQNKKSIDNTLPRHVQC